MPTICTDKCPLQYDEYEFGLSELYRRTAREELQETDEIRDQSLEQMRSWIAKHPYIKKCRTDSLFLLRFLRTRKFSIPRAQETLERYLAMRKTFPKWTHKLDHLEAEMKEVIDDGLFQVLGRDSKGRTVIWIGLGNFKADKFTADHQARFFMLLVETLCLDEEVQIGGFVAILGYKNYSMQHLALWPMIEIKQMLDCINHSLPLRIKEIHAVGLPRFAIAIAELAKSFLSAKLKERLFCHRSIEDVKKHLEVQMLTTEYEGGTQDPEVVKQKFIKQCAEKRQELLQLDEMDIDASRYKSLWHLTTDGSIESGVAGSFRKLNVD